MLEVPGAEHTCGCGILIRRGARRASGLEKTIRFERLEGVAGVRNIEREDVLDGTRDAPVEEDPLTGQVETVPERGAVVRVFPDASLDLGLDVDLEQEFLVQSLELEPGSEVGLQRYARG